MLLRRPFGSSTSAWREMERLRREMNRLFASMPTTFEGTGTSSYPAMNVWANQDGAVVTAELPGVDPEDIDISVVGDTLTVTGTRQPDELEEGETYHRRERRYGRFSRAFRLPFEVEAGQVEAVFEKGILNVTLPRAEVDKPKKIAVKTG